MEFSENVTILEREGKTFYIVGTAHVSRESVEEVAAVIEQIQPDTVCVELCETRYNALTDENRWKKLDVFKVIREGKTLFLLANLAVGAYQRRIGQQLGVKPGAELLEAVKKAKENGAELVLADRDIQATLKRTWANIGFMQKTTLVGAIMHSLISREEIDEETIEKLKGRDQLSEMMKEFAEMMPSVQKPLIDERDQFLMSTIEEAPGEKIVAVVGAGHVEGMIGYFGSEVDREALSVIPEKKKWTKSLKWVIPGIILLAFAYGFSKHSGETLESMLWAWILPNSICAAFMTILALGKPLSVVTAFVASPITSLNPLLGAGMVVGLVEAWLRKPTVADAERINEDVQSLRGLYRNPFTRVLVVVVASTLGSAMGAWIGGAWVVALAAG